MIDTHAHLTDERFASEVAEVVARAAAAGVEAIVTLGTQIEDSREAVRLSESLPGVYAAAGVHPHAASSASDAVLAEVRDLAAGERVVAIGETGLDYHYDFSPRDAQRRAFVRQIEMAAELDLPVVVHSREADDDLEAILRDMGRAATGVLHSFSGGRRLMEAALEVGWMISFSGMVTFKKYQGGELLRAVPRERLMVETDSPYLAPVPHRGKRNEPALVTLVARRAAEIRGEDPEQFAAAVVRNARAFFGLAG